MNRHGYKVRKFGREKDQRRALIKGLANELVLKESIETTFPKAKAVAKYTEKLITKSKKGKDSLHVRRQVITSLTTLPAAAKLVDELAPKLQARSSGHLRIKRTIVRRGDGTQMAKISFVDNLKLSKAKPDTKATGQKKSEEPKATPTRSAAAQDKLQPDKAAKTPVKQVVQAPRRAGRRGDR